MTEREIALQERVGEWWPYFRAEFDKPYVIKIAEEVAILRTHHKVFPEPENVFKAFKMTPPNSTKVILVGQDPYHDGINATGLAFECGGRKSGKQHDVTPSWNLMLKGYDQQYPTSFATDLYMGDLERWAKNGVLLLNSALTVEKGLPGSHKRIWAPFIKMVIETIAKSQRPKAFVFLGRQAQEFQKFVKVPHFSIYREHPMAAGYKDPPRDWEHGDCFKVVNDFLKQTGQEPVDW
jgi:uracil-DNA glycosylase